MEQLVNLQDLPERNRSVLTTLGLSAAMCMESHLARVSPDVPKQLLYAMDVHCMEQLLMSQA